MKLNEYEELKQRLLAKRYKGQVSRREEGYNEGVCSFNDKRGVQETV